MRITLAIVALAIVATATRAPWLVADAHTFTEPWRALTGPLVHATWGHLVRDLALTMIVAIAYEHRMRRVWPALIFCGLALPTLGVLAFTGATAYYGLSGLSHALLAAACVHDRKHAIARIVGALLAAKVIHEVITGAPAFPMDLGAGVRQVPLAHAIGALTGAGVYIACFHFRNSGRIANV